MIPPDDREPGAPRPIKLRPFLDRPHDEECPVCSDDQPRRWGDVLQFGLLLTILALIGLGLGLVGHLTRLP